MMKGPLYLDLKPNQGPSQKQLVLKHAGDGCNPLTSLARKQRKSQTLLRRSAHSIGLRPIQCHEGILPEQRSSRNAR